MKKLYLFLLACLMTCVANAAKVYFQADTWTEVNAYAWSQAGNVSASWPGTPMTLNEDTGLWEVEFSSTPENIIFNNGSSQTDDLKFKDGATYKQDGSIVGEVEELITLTATFDNSLSNWDNVNIYYWEGASVAWPGAAMTKGSDNTYTFTAQVRNLPNKVMFNNGSDAGKTADLAFVNNSVYDMNGLKGDDPTPPTPPTPAVEDLYLVGDNFGGWALDETYKFSKNENVYTLTIPEGLSGEWKIWNGTWDYTFGAGASQPEAGTEAEVWFLSAANFTTETTTETTLTFTLVEGSDVKDSSIPSTLLIEAENGDDPTPPTPVETPEHLYIVGNVNGTSWDVTAPMELTKSGNTFTASDVALIDAGNGYSYFTFITVTGADWDIVNGGDRFGAPAQDTPVVASEPMEMVKYAEGVNASAAQSWMIDSSMEAIDIVVDFENMTMTATRSAGIDAIGNGSTKISVIGGILSVEGAGNVNVFTTDGAHISSSAKTALAPGLYIIVADGKASKVMVK